MILNTIKERFQKKIIMCMNIFHSSFDDYTKCRPDHANRSSVKQFCNLSNSKGGQKIRTVHQYYFNRLSYLGDSDLLLDRWMDECMDGWMDGWIDDRLLCR